MNHKRKQFVNEYTKSGNATSAAIAAGYSIKTAKSQGQRLLTFVDIADAIQAAQENVAKECKITVAGIVAEIKALSTSTKNESIKIKALDMLMKHLGGYISEVAALSKLNDADLDTLMDKIINKQ